MDGGELLDTRQAAAVLGLQPGTLETWRWRGDGPPHVRLSARAIRYRRADLDAWIERQRRISTSDAGDEAA